MLKNSDSSISYSLNFFSQFLRIFYKISLKSNYTSSLYLRVFTFTWSFDEEKEQIHYFEYTQKKQISLYLFLFSSFEILHIFAHLVIFMYRSWTFPLNLKTFSCIIFNTLLCRELKITIVKSMIYSLYSEKISIKTYRIY